MYCWGCWSQLLYKMRTNDSAYFLSHSFLCWNRSLERKNVLMWAIDMWNCHGLGSPILSAFNTIIFTEALKPPESLSTVYYTSYMHLVFNFPLDGIVIDHFYSVPAGFLRNFPHFSDLFKMCKLYWTFQTNNKPQVEEKCRKNYAGTE